MNAAPGSSFEAVFEAGTTGLVGTVALAVLDNEGATVQPFSTAAIIELTVDGDPTGIYAATRTAPRSAGQYTLLWSIDGTTDPGSVASDELVVTYDEQTPVPPPSGWPWPVTAYATVDELAALLRVSAATRGEELSRVLTAAALEIDSEVGRRGNPYPTEAIPELVVQVNLERAVEHWQQQQSPFGIVGLGGDTLPAYTSRDSWERHAHKLAPLKEAWGVA